MQDQVCTLMCVEGGVDRLGLQLLLSPVWPSGQVWCPCHTSYSDAWILLPPAGGFQYGTAFVEVPRSSHVYEDESQVWS